ncbi:hypothetical protein [Hymenobacter rubripertinctus]|uniref:Uncharacterized protein n=2 Tax=Hymenobacter rubripertinctus TaxID=2029981 RepID=A0A418QNQ3_9BACT|nr:hypothetical protein [Hymenobacter rubripertinctus]RIY06907.1 hypothetical protein D0T11_17930 [Hymenobacter rubripertinctus]
MPYHITATSRNLFYRHGRTFPSAGLDQTQIGEAIEAVGLVAELRTYRQGHEWGLLPPGDSASARMQQQLRGAKGFLYAYLRLGLPVLLFLLLDENPDLGHLVTITGYRLAPATALPTPDISLASDALDRLYAHDDQMGPFARYGFTEQGRLRTPWPAEADWQTAEGRWQQHREASLFSLFVPLAADIRITYEQVYRQVGLFEQIFTDTIRERADIVWDIYLDYSNKYKEELRYLRAVSGEPLRRILVTSLPKYIWVARATLQQMPILELVFDATDLHTGFYCLLVNVFDPLRASMTDWLGQPAFRRKLLKAPKFDKRFLSLLLENLEISF